MSGQEFSHIHARMGGLYYWIISWLAWLLLYILVLWKGNGHMPIPVCKGNGHMPIPIHKAAVNFWSVSSSGKCFMPNFFDMDVSMKVKLFMFNFQAPKIWPCIQVLATGLRFPWVISSMCVRKSIRTWSSIAGRRETFWWLTILESLMEDRYYNTFTFSL